MDFQARQKKLREHLATTRFDALLISIFLTSATFAALLAAPDSAGGRSGSVFFTDVRYDTQAHEEVKAREGGDCPQGIAIGSGRFFGATAQTSSGMDDRDRGRAPTVAEKKRLARCSLPGIRIKDAPSVVERARMVKDGDELDRIRAAVALGAKLFDRALEVLRPGVKETEVAGEMEFAARRAGAEEMFFPQSSLWELGRRCRMAALRISPLRRGDSWSATSVLYSKVIVRTRRVLYGSGPFRTMPARPTRRCWKVSRRPSRPCGLESGRRGRCGRS